MAISENRILLTGSAGLLGGRLVPLAAAHTKVFAIFHEEEPEYDDYANMQLVECDLTDSEWTREAVEYANPTVIINCAAMTDVDGCEEDRALARKLNAGIVENILGCISNDLYFVQISTDYLFDGKSGPYPEDAVPNPINVYGLTKLESEAIVRARGGKSLIVRTSALYDSVDRGRANLFASVYERLQNGETVKAAEDLFCNPIWVPTLSEAILEAVELNLTGVLNIAGSVYMSRFEFAQIVAEHYEYPANLIESVPVEALGRAARRPNKAGVDVSKALGLLRTRLVSPSEAFQLWGLLTNSG